MYTSFSNSPPIWEPLPRVDAQSPLALWPGFELMRLGISRPLKHTWHYFTVTLAVRFIMLVSVSQYVNVYCDT